VEEPFGVIYCADSALDEQVAYGHTVGEAASQLGAYALLFA